MWISLSEIQFDYSTLLVVYLQVYFFVTGNCILHKIVLNMALNLDKTCCNSITAFTK